MPEETGCGEARGTPFHRFLDEIDDALQLAIVGLCAFVAALVAHGLEADGGVAAHTDDVERRLQGLDAVEVFAERGPIPGQAIHDRVRGDVLNGFHQLGEVAAVVRAAGREGDAAVADQRRRDTVVGAWPHLGIPADLGVQVRVQVHESGGDDLAGGVDRTSGFDALEVADAADAPVVHGNVGAPCLGAAAVDDGPTGYD